MTSQQRDALRRVIEGHDDENAAGGAMYTDPNDIDMLRPLAAPLSEGAAEPTVTRYRITNPSVWVNAMESPLSEGGE